MITVVDYGVSNLGSVINMARKIGVKVELADNPEILSQAKKIILPGVGAFDQGMSSLAEHGLTEVLKEKALDNEVTILGVCLGMQILAKGSEEGKLDGLGLIDAYCKRFSFPSELSLKVPHMGWNLISRRKISPLLKGLDEKARFYFVHSYHLVCANQDDILANSRYGIDFVSIIEHRNIFGVQFHPEKSHRFGMTLIHNFANM